MLDISLVGQTIIHDESTTGFFLSQFIQALKLILVKVDHSTLFTSTIGSVTLSQMSFHSCLNTASTALAICGIMGSNSSINNSFVVCFIFHSFIIHSAHQGIGRFVMPGHLVIVVTIAAIRVT